MTLITALILAAVAPSPAHGAQGMAATAHPLATQAALDTLAAGGNAVDAAVAATFAISVTEPMSAGIGGGGFAVVWLAGSSTMKALDFRERAPAAATRDMYQKDGKVVPGLSVDGHLSVGVPGTVAGMAELHAKYGKLPWKKVVQPAIQLARKGFVVSEHFTGSFEWRKEPLTRFASSREVFMKRQGGKEVPYEVGDVLVQRELADTLKAIAADPRAFYTGKIGTAIVDEMKRGGGLLTADDLSRYAPTWREPVCGPWQDLTLCTMPPPSSGGVHLLEILNLTSDVDWKGKGWHDVDALHRLIEAMRTAYADRATYLGDPAFVQVPTAQLISQPYADVRKKEIDATKARKSADVKAAPPELLAQLAKESHQTSHLSVVDKDRNAVSLTFTVNYGFGSGVVVPGTGVLLNDEMDDFAAAPGVPNSYGLVGGEANAVQPNKIPLSSMTPLVATKGGKFYFTAGAPGGSTIITTVLQTLLDVAAYGMDCQAAVAAPRLHHQWLPDVTRVDAYGFDKATIAALQQRGHNIVVADEPWGNAMCIVERDGVLEGGADPRGEGTAAGLR